MPPMGDNADVRAEGLAAQQDAGEQQQDANAGTGAQASLTAAADQNGTEGAAGEQTGAKAEGAQQNSADQPDDELAAALGAFKSEVETLKTALGVVGDRITAVDDRLAALETRYNHGADQADVFVQRFTALEGSVTDTLAQFETVKVDIAALNSADHGAPIQEIAARVEAFEQALAQLEAARQVAPPDAETIGKLIADLEGRLNSLVLKLRHML